MQYLIVSNLMIGFLLHMKLTPSFSETGEVSPFNVAVLQRLAGYLSTILFIILI
jgi:hypothetical protein